ncbi:MAG: pyridoxal-phosphate dependent enzyme [Cyanobacteriota bacterium]|nr:pyridoxal-phosphate dependent enzyme [Cyanobacteriota bacterium]
MTVSPPFTNSPAPLPLTIRDIEAAANRITPFLQPTPLFTSRTFDQIVHNQCFFKGEHYQRGGSFKVRGAMNRILQLGTGERERGVVAFSSGNHSQGVAIAAKTLGIPATIVMPNDAPQAKRQATLGYGAEIVDYDRQQQDREAIAQELARERGLTLIPPYDDWQIIAGQGTVALELFQQVADLDVLMVPLGGGGLLSGCSMVARTVNPTITIYGVEPETGDDFYQSLQKGERVRIPVPDTIADGIRTTYPGVCTFAVIRQMVDGVLLVSDAEILQAMRFLLYRMKMVVEPTGAVAVAALLSHKLAIQGKRVGLVLSGGNVDAEILAQAL